MKTLSKFNKYTIGLAIVTLLLLSIPLIAMQFTAEVNWTLSDFIFAAIMIFGTGMAYGLIALKMESKIFKFAVAIGLFSSLFLVWANLAVGIIGNENNPANLMYFGVIAIGLISAFYFSFKPAGLMRTLFIMAIAQTSTIVIAIIMDVHHQPGITILELIRVNAIFIVLFILSGLLFRQASMEGKG